MIIGQQNSSATLQVLDEAQCFELLARQPVGRLGFSCDVLPVILPVNFVLDGRTVVFRSSAGAKLDAAQAQVVACIEVDSHDPISHEGWSVLATGRLVEITDPERKAAIEQLPLRPWGQLEGTHAIELRIELISGRRIQRSSAVAPPLAPAPRAIPTAHPSTPRMAAH